jgi:hypothetical protein
MNYPVIVHAQPGEQIREHVTRVRAYEVYLQRGGNDAHAQDDWLEAELDVLGGNAVRNDG